MRPRGKTAEREAVRFLLTGEEFGCLGDELLGDGGRLFTRRVAGFRVERRNAGGLRIGVVDVAAEALAAEHDDEAMLLDRLTKHFDPGDLYVAQADGERRAFLRSNAARATVGDFSGRVERAPIA